MVNKGGKWSKSTGNTADAITGERIFDGKPVFDTGYPNINVPYIANSRTRLVKEETIVWLAEQAGYTVSRNDGTSSPDPVSAGTPEPAPVVEREDVNVGNGETPVGADPVGGRTAPKRRSNGTPKSK